MEQKNALVALTRNELLYLDDVLTIDSPESDAEPMRGIISSAKATVSRACLLRIGSALLQIYEKEDGTSTVGFSEEELWCIRETADSDAMFGKERVGINIKIKVHKALQSIQKYAEPVQEILDRADTEEPSDNSSYDVKRKLQEWQEVTDGNRSPYQVTD